jgi:hypothetical protein
MRKLPEIEQRINELTYGGAGLEEAAELLQLGEEVLEHWVIAHDQVPTEKKYEGFRILALQRQGSKGNPSFNAVRETARELVYHHNLIASEPDHPDTKKRLTLAGLVANHLYLFISGKMEVAELGEFCCSAKPLHDQPEIEKIGEGA